MSSHFTSPRQRQVNERSAMLRLQSRSAGRSTPESDIEREQIVQTLRHFSGNRQQTARALGIGVRTLGLKLKKWKEEHLVAQTI